MKSRMKTFGGIMMVVVLSGMTAWAADNEKPRSNPGGAGAGAWGPGSAPAMTINVQGNGGVVYSHGNASMFGIAGKGMTYASGEIKEVRGDAIVLTINGNVWKKGEGYGPAPVDDIFMVTDKTKINFNGEEVKLEKLSPGLKAGISCKKEGISFVAEAVNVNLSISGMIKSVGKDSFVLAVNNYVPSKDAASGMELKKEDWTILVDDNTKSMGMGKMATGKEPLPDLDLADLKENDSCQVSYSSKEKRDDAGNVTVTATKVFIYGKMPQRGSAALKGQ